MELLLRLLLLLLLLWTPTRAQGSTMAQVVCVVKETCLIPCSFSIKDDLQGIDWIQTNKQLLVHSYSNGKDQLENQDRAFWGRTSMFPEQILRGNGSLQLSHVKLMDQGTYVCRVFTSGFSAYNWVEIKVEGPVRAVTLEQRGDVLVCSSEDLHPQPNVSWTPHSEQQAQSLESTEDQLFSISSSLPLELPPPLSYSCNISTPTSWKSATYSLQPPIKMSPTISIPCVDSMVPEKSLEWTFNYIHTIVTRSGAEVTVADSWRLFVERVSESGSLSLKDLSPKQEGVFVCEVHTDHITYISKTEVENEDPSPAWFIVVIVLLIIVILVIVIVVLWKRGVVWKWLRRLGIVKKHQSKIKILQDQESKLMMKKRVLQTSKLQKMLQDTFHALSEDELQMVKSLLMDQSFMEEFPSITEHELDEEEDITNVMVKAYDVHSFRIAKRILQKLKRNDLMEKLPELKYDKDITEKCKNEITSRLKEMYKCLPEGTRDSSEKMKFTEGYTELFITERDFAQKENSTKERTLQDIFRGHAQNSEPIRIVLTKGVAGVGKTVLSQKFSLDWAEGRANQDIQLLFPFTFRELNVLKGAHFSLVGLIHHFFSETKHLYSFQHLQLLFIFDGLYECRFSLDFSQTRVLHRDTETGTVEELLVNLIRGNLLPSAHLWITTRPAAAIQIPPKFVSMVTEVRGFTDQQKEQYFRKRLRDEQQAGDVISHIKNNRSLDIMSNIPLFCWILSVILPELKTTEKEQPFTLTQIYIYFLMVQTKVDDIKDNVESGKAPHMTLEREMVQSLGKLAFEQLRKGHFIFNNRNLSTCGLDTAGISRYSRIIAQVREESEVDQSKGYSFIHLSVQEFLAAFHVHQTFFSSGQNLLSPRSSKTSDSKNFYRSVVDMALANPNGHMDLFICFLLGLSLPNNQRLLSGLLTQTQNDLTVNQDTVNYIHDKLNKKDLLAKKGLNLLHCLRELKDDSLMEKIQEFMRKRRPSDLISPAEWSALSSLLLSSHLDLQEFDLRNYFPTEKGLLGLLPIIKVSTKIILSSCGLSKTSCGSHALASVLVSSSLTHLDLSNNDLQDSGVEQLCDGLKSISCGLETLNLSLCGLSSRSCDPLASVLVSSSIAHLDLSNNDLQDSGVETLCKRLKSTTCRLETLKLSGCLISKVGGASLASVLSSSFSQLQELDLSYNHLGASAEQLTSLPNNYHCTVRVNPCGEQFLVLGLRKYACELSMDSNTAHKDLHLSERNRTVTFQTKEHLDSDHEDRFTDWCQVLSSTGLRGRCYWEVVWSGEKVDIAVSYKRIKRKGNMEECAFGGNDHSWSLLIWEGHCVAVYKNKKTILPGRVGMSTGKHSDQVDLSLVQPGVPAGGAGMSEDKKQSVEMSLLLNEPARLDKVDSSSGELREFSGRVAVFLDFDAGVLSFYDVTSTDGNQRRHIHTFSLSFTELLYPGFGVDSGSSVTVVPVKSFDLKQELIQF